MRRNDEQPVYKRLPGLTEHRFKFHRFLFLTALWLTLITGGLYGTGLAHAEASVAEAEMEAAFALLKDRSFKKKGAGVDRLAGSGHERAGPLLQSLLKGRLFYVRETGEMVIGEKAEGGYRLTGALWGAQLGVAKKKALKKITINNKLRGRIRTAIATLNLTHADADVRLSAVTKMLGAMDADLARRLEALLENESDEQVQQAMGLGIALSKLRAPEKAERLAAIKALEDSLHPAVRNRLTDLSQSDPDAAVKEAAGKALRNVQGKIDFFGGLETLFFGLSLGSVLVLAGIGLAITFGVMGVINMAHGELIMLGAYTTYMVQQLMPDAIGASLWIAIPAAFLVSGSVGILIERGVIRFLYGRPLETLLATFGISLILQQLVRTLISPQNVPVANPDWMSGSLVINEVLSLTYNRIYILIFALLVFAALYLVLKKTALGLQVRAVSQNRAMARAMGVRSQRVDALTFGLGSGIAGVAGVALSQLTNVGPNLGQSYIVDSFMVVVFGGVGNLFGTLIAGLSLGVANKVLEPWAGAVLAKILVLVFIILFIQKRPRGLFPQRGRAAEA